MLAKVCLINPPWRQPIRADYSDLIEKDAGFYPPLGLQYLSAVCKKKGYETLIVDCQPEGLDYKGAAEKIKAYDPKIIGLTGMTFNLLDLQALMPEIKKSVYATNANAQESAIEWHGKIYGGY